MRWEEKRAEEMRWEERREMRRSDDKSARRIDEV